MSLMATLFCGILGLLALLALGTPLSPIFLIVGFFGAATILSPDAAYSLLGETLYSTLANPSFTVLPLFILMGAFAAKGGFAKLAFDAVHIMAARVPASLAIAASFGNAFFASLCGSSMAATSVFGKIAYPAMMAHKYDRPFALGSIASSGTFACLIPPSSMFILFALFTGLPVAKLFMAGIIPGLLTATVYALSMYLRAKRDPNLAPIAPIEYTYTPKDRVKAAIGLWPIVLLASIILGGMYSGLFTPSEAGAVGTLGTLVFGLVSGGLRSMKTFKEVMQETARTTAMMVFIIVTAMVFSRFLALTRFPIELAEFLQAWNVHRVVVLIAIMLLWFVLGMFMAQAAVFALTLPILFPVVMSLGYDPIWFCVIAMKLNEIAAVSPPVGLNIFTLAGTVAGKDNDISVEEIYKGCFPFILCDIVVIILLILFPSIVTFLPNSMN